MSSSQFHFAREVILAVLTATVNPLLFKTIQVNIISQFNILHYIYYSMKNRELNAIYIWLSQLQFSDHVNSDYIILHKDILHLLKHLLWYCPNMIKNTYINSFWYMFWELRSISLGSFLDISFPLHLVFYIRFNFLLI